MTTPLTTTTTNVASSLNPPDYADDVTFTATVSPDDGGGAVAFSADDSTINGCSAQTLKLSSGLYQATCSVSSLSVGTRYVTAIYGGDVTYGGSTSPVLTQTDDQAPGSLAPGNELSVGQSITAPGGAYHLNMQSDGNLVEYTSVGSVVWASGTAGNSGAYADMQSAGNLVVYSSSGIALWASGTAGDSGAYLVLKAGADLVVESSSGVPIIDLAIMSRPSELPTYQTPKSIVAHR